VTALLAVPGLVATGSVDEARAVLADADGRGGTLLDGAATLMARGMLATLDGPVQTALSQLARAAVLLEPVAAATLLPDTPAALTAVVAVQCGELPVAQTALRRALAHGHGGRSCVTGDSASPAVRWRPPGSRSRATSWWRRHSPQGSPDGPTTPGR
jgi:hypothetical protein